MILSLLRKQRCVNDIIPVTKNIDVQMILSLLRKQRCVNDIIPVTKNIDV